MSGRTGDYPSFEDMLPNRISDDHAAAEFYIRAILASPLKSYIKIFDLTEPLGVSNQRAGQVLAELAAWPDSALDVVERRDAAMSRTIYRFDVDREAPP